MIQVRSSLTGLVLAGTLCLLMEVGGTAGAPQEPWQPILPPDVAKELTARSLQALKGNGAHTDADVMEAQLQVLLLADYAASVQGADLLQGTRLRQAAFPLAARLTSPQGFAKVRKTLESQPGVRGLPDEPVEPWKAEDKGRFFADMMRVLMERYPEKARGGVGLPPALRPLASRPGVKDGIESALLYLGAHELPPEMLAKQAEELALLGYQLAVEGQVTHELVRESRLGAGNLKAWRRSSLGVRTAGVALAEAATKRDALGVRKGAAALNTACKQCHDRFIEFR